jgi:heterodisulfide reductase subunit B
MDKIDMEIKELFEEKKRMPAGKFLALLALVMGTNTVLVLISLFTSVIFIRMILLSLSGILITGFFLWFFFRFYRK